MRLKIMVLLTMFSVFCKADDLSQKKNAVDFFLKNVTTYSQVRSIINGSTLTQDRKKYLLSNLPYDGAIPKISLNADEVSVLENGKTTTLKIIDQDKGIMSVNGTKVSLDFDKNFQGSFEKIFSAANSKSTSLINKLFINEAYANGAVAALEIAAGIAAYALCEKRQCGHEILAFLVGPAYLLWVAADMFLISKASAAEVAVKNIVCPQNNSGKLEYSFGSGSQAQTLVVEYDDSKNPTRLREIKDGKTVATHFLSPDWKVTRSEGATRDVDYSKMAQSLKPLSQECSKNPKKIEAVNGVALSTTSPSKSNNKGEAAAGVR